MTALRDQATRVYKLKTGVDAYKHVGRASVPDTPPPDRVDQGMTDIAKKAEAWVSMSHEGRTYAGGPYTKHLGMVVHTLKRYGFASPLYQACGWLHDDLEDTDTTLEQLEAEFGSDVAAIVFAVTDELGKNRHERHRRTYPKIAAMPEAIVIKLADRIVNVATGWATRDPKLFMYRDEHGFFRETLFSADTSRTVLAMWAELDKLLGWDEWAQRAYDRKKRR